MSRRSTNSMSRKARSTSRGSMLSRKPAVTIGTNPCADGGTPKPSRFPIRLLPTAPGNALWVSATPSNVAYWGQSEKHVLHLRFTAFDPLRTCCTSATTANKRPYPSAATARIIDGNPHRELNSGYIFRLWGHRCREFSLLAALALLSPLCRSGWRPFTANLRAPRLHGLAGSTQKQARLSQIPRWSRWGQRKTQAIPIMPAPQQ